MAGCSQQVEAPAPAVSILPQTEAMDAGLTADGSAGVTEIDANNESVVLKLPPFVPVPGIAPSPAPCRLEGRVVASSFLSDIAGDQLDYRIYLPPCYGLDGHAYPTLYIFAGNIHDENFWDMAGLDEAAEQAIRVGRIPPMLIVMPDGGYMANNTSGGPYSYEGIILDELIPHIEENYCSWRAPEGRAIGGLSRGGYWALEIAFRNPELFAGVGGHSASLLDYGAGPDMAPRSTGVSNQLGDLRIYLDIGQNDWLRYDLEELHNALEAANIEHIWHLNDGEHVDAYWVEHAAEYLRWYGSLWSTERTDIPVCQ